MQNDLLLYIFYTFSVKKWSIFCCKPVHVIEALPILKAFSGRIDLLSVSETFPIVKIIKSFLKTFVGSFTVKLINCGL